MKSWDNMRITRIGFKDLMLFFTIHTELGVKAKEDFPTIFPQFFHTFSTMEKSILIMVLARFPQKRIFPFFFNREGEYSWGTFMIYFLSFNVQVFYFYLFLTIIFAPF
jgi:hypothetical protein